MHQPTQSQVFGVLVLIWLGILGVQVLSPSAPQQVPLVNRTGPKSPGNSSGVEKIQFDDPADLQAGHQAFQAPPNPSKNIFAPLQFASSSSFLQQPPKPQPKVEVIKTPLSPSAEELAAEQARKEMARYRFLGLVQEGDTQKVFLAKDQEIFILTVGDSVGGDIKVSGIQATSVQLRYGNTSIVTTIPISNPSNLGQHIS